MLREKTLHNLRIDGEDISRSVIMDGDGRVLKIFVEFSNNPNTTTTVKITTKEGEELLNVKSDKPNTVFYPRVNIISQKYDETNISLENLNSTDYFYFVGGLLVTVERDNINSEDVLIKKITILYEEC